MTIIKIIMEINSMAKKQDDEERRKKKEERIINEFNGFQ